MGETMIIREHPKPINILIDISIQKLVDTALNIEKIDTNTPEMNRVTFLPRVATILEPIKEPIIPPAI
jgi:hypothetical protein